MLLMRLHEVGALAELDEVSKSEVFLKAAGTSVLNVGKGVASAVKDPGATAKGVGEGVKRFGTNLGRKAKRTGDKAVDSATSDDDKKAEGEEKSTTDKAAAAGTGMAYSMLGVNKAARKWAQKVGVDPYTTNPILKKALTDLGRIDAAGGIAAKVVVPIPMVVSGTASVGNLVWAKDPEELLKINEQKFKELGVGADVIKQLYLSKGFSLSLHTRFADEPARGERARLRRLRRDRGRVRHRARGALLRGERRDAGALPQDGAGRGGAARLARARGEDQGRPRRGDAPGRLGAAGPRPTRRRSPRSRSAPRRSSAPRSSSCA